jgi:hypothetical protein
MKVIIFVNLTSPQAMGSKAQEHLSEWTTSPAQVQQSSKSLVSSGVNLHWGVKVVVSLVTHLRCVIL